MQDLPWIQQNCPRETYRYFQFESYWILNNIGISQHMFCSMLNICLKTCNILRRCLSLNFSVGNWWTNIATVLWHICGIKVTISLSFQRTRVNSRILVRFVMLYLYFCPSFENYVVYLSSIYSSWSLLLYPQTVLNMHHQARTFLY
jgi:hypothetical protein